MPERSRSAEHSEREPGRITLSQDERKALRRLAGEFASGFEQTQSVSLRRRFGAGRVGRFSVVIRQDPTNPDTVQICTEVNMDGDVACWCEPPGTCEPGPC
jgi:hypothetical protein